MLGLKLIHVSKRGPRWLVVTSSRMWHQPRLDDHHGDVIKWQHFPRYWPFVWGIQQSPVNSLHKDLWRGDVTEMIRFSCFACGKPSNCHPVSTPWGLVTYILMLHWIRSLRVQVMACSLMTLSHYPTQWWWTEPLRRHLSETLIEIQIFSIKKMHWICRL